MQNELSNEEVKLKTPKEILYEELTPAMVDKLEDLGCFEDFVIDAMGAYAKQEVDQFTTSLKKQVDTMREALDSAIDRMTRARGILNRQDGASNWGMLDASDLTEAIKKGENDNG